MPKSLPSFEDSRSLSVNFATAGFCFTGGFSRRLALSHAPCITPRKRLKEGLKCAKAWKPCGDARNRQHGRNENLEEVDVRIASSFLVCRCVTTLSRSFIPIPGHSVDRSVLVLPYPSDLETERWITSMFILKLKLLLTI